MFSYILPTKCFINNEQTVIDDMSKPLNIINPFEAKMGKNEINNEIGFKPFPFISNIEKGSLGPSKQYLKNENIFNPFEDFTLNRNLNDSPKIIITRFSRPKIHRNRREEDSLDDNSSIGNFKHFINKSPIPKRNVNRHLRSTRVSSRHVSKKRNKVDRKQTPSFLTSCLNYIKSISLIRIIMYILFTVLFIFVGYHLRKNEEESNYVRLAPQ